MKNVIEKLKEFCNLINLKERFDFNFDIDDKIFSVVYLQKSVPTHATTHSLDRYHQLQTLTQKIEHIINSDLPANERWRFLVGYKAEIDTLG